MPTVQTQKVSPALYLSSVDFTPEDSHSRNKQINSHNNFFFLRKLKMNFLSRIVIFFFVKTLPDRNKSFFYRENNFKQTNFSLQKLIGLILEEVIFF